MFTVGDKKSNWGNGLCSFTELNGTLHLMGKHDGMGTVGN